MRSDLMLYCGILSVRACETVVKFSLREGIFFLSYITSILGRDVWDCVYSGVELLM